MALMDGFNQERSIDITKSKKLEKEVNQLSSLKDVLTRSKQVATNVGTILDSFDHRLGRLEMTILPVYRQTANLQRRQMNTEKTIQALDYVIGFYNVAGEMEGVIRERPSSIGISQYLQAMDKISSAAKYFETNNPQAIELENLKSILEMGCQQLSVEFRDELKKYQKSFQPIVTMEIIELELSDLNEDLMESVELMPLVVREDLRNIAFWLDKNSYSDRLTFYAKQRAYALSESLKALRTYQRTSSAERGASTTASPAGAANSPAFLRSRPLKDSSRVRQHKISQRATRALLRAMPVQASVTRRQGTSSTAEDFLDESDISIYLNQVTALHRLSFLELLLCQQLVPPDKVTRAFEMIVKDSINELAIEGEVLAFTAHRSVARGDLAAILLLLALLKHMTLMQSQYDSLLASCQVSFRTKFATTVNTLQETTSKALDGYIFNLKSDGGGLPKDGTVHELTSNTVIFVEQLLDFAVTLAPILQKDGNFHSEKTHDSQKAKMFLGMYIKRVLSNLGLALVHKSYSYSDPTLCAIFCLNNYNYILKTLQSSDILSILLLAEPNCCQTYNNFILEQKNIYEECLRKLVTFMDSFDDLPLSSLRGEKLRDRDRQFIKDKFYGFNKEIEDMQRIQRGYSIPDLELRESIKRDNKEIILPKYQAFYDRYIDVHFAKTPEKYIKYTPSDVSNKLDEFFDVAA